MNVEKELVEAQDEIRVMTTLSWLEAVARLWDMTPEEYVEEHWDDLSWDEKREIVWCIPLIAPNAEEMLQEVMMSIAFAFVEAGRALSELLTMSMNPEFPAGSTPIFEALNSK